MNNTITPFVKESDRKLAEQTQGNYTCVLYVVFDNGEGREVKRKFTYDMEPASKSNLWDFYVGPFPKPKKRIKKAIAEIRKDDELVKRSVVTPNFRATHAKTWYVGIVNCYDTLVETAFGVMPHSCGDQQYIPIV